jgi:hypothetical protein
VRGRPARMRAGGARTAQARRGSPKTSPCESAHLRVAPGARASRPHARRRRAHRARGAFLAEMRGHSHAHLPPHPSSCPCSHTGNAPRGACAVRRRRKTHTLCGVSAQATPPAALTPDASSAGNATGGAPPDADDTGAAILTRRGAALSTAARMGDACAGHAAGGYDRRSGAAVAARVRPGKNGIRICVSSRITCGRFERARARRCAAVESSADHGRRVCQLRLPDDCAHQGVRSPSTSRC